MSQQHTLCQPLHQVIEQGKPLWGGQLALNEAAFTGATATIRDTVRPAIQGVGKGAQQGTILMTKVSTLENYVAKQGTGRVFGRVVVKKAEFDRLVNDICTSLQSIQEFLPASKSV